MKRCTLTWLLIVAVFFNMLPCSVFASDEENTSDAAISIENNFEEEDWTLPGEESLPVVDNLPLEESLPSPDSLLPDETLSSVDSLLSDEALSSAESLSSDTSATGEEAPCTDEIPAEKKTAEENLSEETPAEENFAEQSLSEENPAEGNIAEEESSGSPGKEIITLSSIEMPSETESIPGNYADPEVRLKDFVSSVLISAPATCVAVRKSLKLSAAVATAGGGKISVVWTTSDPAIATVSSGGVVKGIKKGTVTITAWAGDETDYIDITVLQPITGLKLSEKKLSMETGGNALIAYSVTDPSGEADIDLSLDYDETYLDVKSCEDNTSLILTAKQFPVRSTNLTVKDRISGKSAKLTISIGAPANCVTTTMKSLEVGLLPGKTVSLKANAAISGSKEKPIDTTLSWISSDERIATVDAKGKVKAMGLGSCEITAAPVLGEGCLTFFVSVTPRLKSFSLYDKNGRKFTKADVVVGSVIDLYDYITQQSIGLDGTSGRDKALEYCDLTFTTLSPSSVISLDEEGRVTARGAGSAKVTVMLTCGSQKKTVSISLRIGQEANIVTTTVKGAPNVSLQQGKTVTLKASGGIEGKSAKPISTAVIWSSADPAIAKVDEKGKVTGIGIGRTTIRAASVTNESVYYDFIVSVCPGLKSFTLYDENGNAVKSVSAVVGNDIDLYKYISIASMQWADGETHNQTELFTIKIDIKCKNGVAELLDGRYLRLNDIGSITATYTLTAGTQKTAKLTVNAGKAANYILSDLSGITNVTSSELVSRQRYVTGGDFVTPGYFSTPGWFVTWGNLRTKRTKETVVRSYADFSLEIGETRRITAVAAIFGSSTLPVSKSVLWTSDNTNVARVDSNGKVTAVGNGICVITAASGIGTGKLFCTVQVGPDPFMTRGMLCNQIAENFGFSYTTNLSCDFADVTEDSEYYQSISTLSSMGIVFGYGDGFFGPEDRITRAAAATILYRAMYLEYPVWSSYTKFTDVPRRHWASAYINEISNLGVIKGAGRYFAPESYLKSTDIDWNSVIENSMRKYTLDATDVAPDAVCLEAATVLSYLGIMTKNGDGSFHPDAGVTRAEAAVWLVKALGITPDRATATFTDVPASRTASDYIATCCSLGILSGFPDGSFQPDQTVSYNQAITMVCKALGYTDENLQGTWPQIYVSKAISQGLLDNIIVSSGTEMIDRAGFSILLYNALDQTLYDCEDDTMFARLGVTPISDKNGKLQWITADDNALRNSLTDISSYYKKTITAYAADDGRILSVRDIQDTSRTESMLTRGHLCHVIVNEMGFLYDPAMTVSFSDVPAGHPYAESIAILVNKGIVTGCTNECFCPEQLVTRAEAAAMLTDAMNISGITLSDTNYLDVSSSHEASGCINYITGSEIMDAYWANYFAPDLPVRYEDIDWYLVRSGSVRPLEIKMCADSISEQYCVDRGIGVPDAFLSDGSVMCEGMPVSVDEYYGFWEVSVRKKDNYYINAYSYFESVFYQSGTPYDAFNYHTANILLSPFAGADPIDADNLTVTVYYYTQKCNYIDEIALTQSGNNALISFALPSVKNTSGYSIYVQISTNEKTQTIGLYLYSGITESAFDLAESYYFETSVWDEAEICNELSKSEEMQIYYTGTMPATIASDMVLEGYQQIWCDNADVIITSGGSLTISGDWCEITAREFRIAENGILRSDYGSYAEIEADSLIMEADSRMSGSGLHFYIAEDGAISIAGSIDMCGGLSIAGQGDGNILMKIEEGGRLMLSDADLYCDIINHGSICIPQSGNVYLAHNNCNYVVNYGEILVERKGCFTVAGMIINNLGEITGEGFLYCRTKAQTDEYEAGLKKSGDYGGTPSTYRRCYFASDPAEVLVCHKFHGELRNLGKATCLVSVSSEQWK